MQHMAPLRPRRGRDAEFPPKTDLGTPRCASPAGRLRSIQRQLPRRIPVDSPGLQPPFNRMGGQLEQRHEGLITTRMLAACFSRRDIVARTMVVFGLCVCVCWGRCQQSDLQDSPPDWMKTSSPVSLGLASRDRQGGKRRERMQAKHIPERAV
ncbi:hypothetical protein HPB52_021398 [Rhipicephalus sanguineus]|uniref:Uncharacterized protein n=1 Tax=Rhipicephalus sanguineus TaxID=34632 RepID=A0A9D4PJY8_RHISA|nr:hypothetical protein HPB52_021398 [Rhipicephalus sanguineus]